MLTANELDFLIRLEAAVPEIRFYAQVAMGAGEVLRGIQTLVGLTPAPPEKSYRQIFNDSQLRSTSAISVAFEVRLEHVGFLWKSDGSSVASIAPPDSGCS